MPIIHAEIEYTRKNGTKVHSDICPSDCNSKNMQDEEYRKYLHRSLDEWLNNSGGTGGFYVKEEKYHFEMFYGEDS